MPKETIDIRAFGGIVGSADPHDLGEGVAAHAENIDFVQQQGLFAPLPDDDAWGAGGFYFGRCDKVTVFDNGERAVIVDRRTPGSDSSPTVRVLSLASTMSQLDSAAVTRSSWDCAVGDGETVHVGLGPDANAKPKWAGYVFHKQFTNKAYEEATTGLDIYDAEIKRSDCVGVYIANTTTLGVEYPGYTSQGNNLWFREEECNLKVGTTYYYYASLTYDGIQEGPLRLIAVLSLMPSAVNLTNAYDYSAISPSTATTIAKPGGGYYTWAEISDEYGAAVAGGKAAVGLRSVSLVLRVRKTTANAKEVLPRRVTGINIYRYDSLDNTYGAWFSGILGGTPYFKTMEALAQGEPAFLKQISVVEDSGWAASGATGAAAASSFDELNDTFQYITFKDNYKFGERTFTARTGFAPTMEHMQLHYGISCAADARHIVGRCWHPDLKEIESWVFRSQPYKYDTFDWANDYLVLPSTPNALVSWAGRVYAFCRGRTYVIDPTTFDIEDTWEGIGAMHEKGVVITDRGMFWADDNNLYWHDGSRVNIIGTPILKSQYSANIGWLSRKTSTSESNRMYDPVAAYDARYDLVFFFCVGGDSASRAFQFHIGTQRWSTLTFTAAGPFNCAFQMPNGLAAFSAYESGNDQFYKLMSSSSKRAWKWVSAQMGFFGAKTRLYHVYVGYKTAKPTVKFYRNDEDYSSATTVSTWSTGVDSAEIDKGELTASAGVWQSFREFALELSGTSGQDVTGLSVIQRQITPR